MSIGEVYTRSVWRFQLVDLYPQIITPDPDTPDLINVLDDGIIPQMEEVD